MDVAWRANCTLLNYNVILKKDAGIFPTEAMYSSVKTYLINSGLAEGVLLHRVRRGPEGHNVLQTCDLFAKNRTDGLFTDIYVFLYTSAWIPIIIRCRWNLR